MADQENQYEELLPPKGNEHVGYRVFALLDEVLKNKQDLGLPTKWARNYELKVNRHWKSETKNFTLITANLLHVHRQKTVNLLTDNYPTFNVRKAKPDDQDQMEIEGPGGQPGATSPGESQDDIYDKLLRTAEYWWQEEEQQSVLEASVDNGEVYGATIEKTYFNPDREYGLGEVETKTIDPFYFGFYPPTCQKLQDCEAVFHFYPITIRESKRRWPKAAKNIKADNDILKNINDTRREIIQGQAKNSAMGTFSGIVKSLAASMGFASLSGDNDQVLVVEAWTKDYSTASDGSPLYPGWIRCVTTCNGGEIVLDDRANPSINPLLNIEQAMQTYLFDKFPFAMVPSNLNTVTPWGMSDFDQLRQLQEEIDKTLSQIGLLKDRASRAKLINPTDSGVHNSQFTNRPGILNPTTAQTAQGIRYMSPPEIPQDLIKALEIYRDLFQAISGAFELERAKTPGLNVIANQALAKLMENASTMIRGKIRNYYRLIRERGRMFLSCAMNWYTEDRFISYEQDGEEMVSVINGNKMIIPAKLTVVSGSTMPRSQVEERDEAIGMFDKGMIDREEALKKMDWPNRKEVIKRMNAGPIGQAIQNAEAIGFPPQLLQAIQQVGQMEPKELATAIKSGQVPMFPQIMQQLMAEQGQQPAPGPEPGQLAEQAQVQKITAETARIAAEAKKIEAEINKVATETNLLLEKVQSEKVDQQVKIAGVQFDQAEMNIRKAETVKSLATPEVVKAPAGKPSTNPPVPTAEQHNMDVVKGITADNAAVNEPQETMRQAEESTTEPGGGLGGGGM